LVKATTAGPESRAAAPPAAGPTGSGGNPGKSGPGPGGGNTTTNENGSEAGPENGNLAFTGANLVWLAMLGLGLLGAGFGLAGAVSRSRRPSLQT
jgi:hypothetical protein